MSNESLRAEHDQVLEALSTRVSTLHYAHAAVSLFVAIICLSTAAMFWWDYWIAMPQAAISSGVAGALALLYSLSRLTFGLQASGREKSQLVRLLDLRRTLQLDAPLSVS